MRRRVTPHVTPHVTPGRRVVTRVSRVTPPRAYAHVRACACVCGACRNSETHVTTRVVGVTHAVTQAKHEGTAMEERKKEGAAAAMPQMAAWVAELWQALGADVVDKAMAASQQARREHQRRVAQFGQAQADAWLARQKWPVGRIWLQEAGREVGVRL